MKYRGILASSSNPEELSKTIDGIVVGASSLIMFVGLNFFHVSIVQADVTTFAASLSAVVGGVMAIRGLILKIINTFGKQPA